MRASVFYGAGDIRVEERAVPEIGADEVLVRIKAAGICGSDLHGYRSAPRRTEGRLFGHEYSGQVVEIGGDVERVSVGDRVGLEPLVGCGKCDYCRAGSYHLCPNLWHIPGFMEYQKFPKGKVFRLPENVSYEEASTLDCIAVAVHAVKLSGLKEGETATVLGAGTIGLLTMQTVKAFGASAVYETGAYDFQVELAEELGANAAVNVKTEDLLKRMMELTGKEIVRGQEMPRGVDHVFEAVGGPKSPLKGALRIVRRGGTVTAIGSPRKPVSISSFVMREIKIVGSSSYAYYNDQPEFEVALGLLSSKKVNAQRLITHTFSLGEISQAFEVAADKSSESVKVLVKP